MPTLEELKDKWFLTLDDEENALNKRHPGTKLTPFTDKNEVVELIDGAAVMNDFHDGLKTLIEFMQANPDTTNPPQAWITFFAFSDVELLGPDSIKADQWILEAAEKGVIVRFLISNDLNLQKRNPNFVSQFIEKLNSRKYGGKRTGFAALDTPYLSWSAHHQKLYIFFHPDDPLKWKAVVGSADVNAPRWDTQDHSRDKPSHEVSVRIRGPAVRDIALTFAERWNNNTVRTEPRIDTLIETEFLDSDIELPAGAKHSVQVLRTYPINPDYLDSGLDYGEFTVWGAYLKAIIGAKKYIYIEDQYFNSFQVPPAFEAPPGSLLRKTDLVFQLGERIKEGVHVIVLVPDKHDDGYTIQPSLIRQKIVSAAYLDKIADQSESGRFVIKTLHAESGDQEVIFVHSKLMIVDDEFVLIGTANFGQRSMTYDSEIHLGIIDENEGSPFARRVRLKLWTEHLQVSESEISDPLTGIDKFAEQEGRVTALDLGPPLPDGNCCHKKRMNKFAQPYGGPKRSS